MTTTVKMFPAPGMPASKVVHLDGTSVSANADGTFTVPQALVPAMLAGGYLVSESVAAPATSSSPGIPGQWAYDSGYAYFCIAANSWRRVATVTF